jgi:hypothetical protein
MSKIDRTERSDEESGRGPRLDRRLVLAAGAAWVGITAGPVAGAGANRKTAKVGWFVVN